MNGTKESAEAVNRKVIKLEIEIFFLVGERSDLGWSISVSKCGRIGSENVGLSNENIGENPMPRKPKGSSRKARPRRVSQGLRQV